MRNIYIQSIDFKKLKIQHFMHNFEKWSKFENFPLAKFSPEPWKSFLHKFRCRSTFFYSEAEIQS